MVAALCAQAALWVQAQVFTLWVHVFDFHELEVLFRLGACLAYVMGWEVLPAMATAFLAAYGAHGWSVDMCSFPCGRAALRVHAEVVCCPHARS